MKREALSVLVFEPNRLQSDLIKLALIRHHMRPIICTQTADLRQQLTYSPPDALLLDTYLPAQNGLDLIAQLSADTLLNRTKFFFISSMAFPEIVQKAAKMGASGFLLKPLNPDLLAARILQSFGRLADFPNQHRLV